MYLVRHAMTVIDAAVPSAEWVLSAEGRVAAAQLELPSLPVLTSDEPKAMDTARLAGWDAVPDSRLREVTRPFHGGGTYEERVARYLAGEELEGWERRDDALRRLHAALDGFDGIAVTHGLAISLFAGLSFEEWQAMPFPAVLEC